MAGNSCCAVQNFFLTYTAHAFDQIVSNNARSTANRQIKYSDFIKEKKKTKPKDVINIFSSEIEERTFCFSRSLKLNSKKLTSILISRLCKSCSAKTQCSPRTEEIKMEEMFWVKMNRHVICRDKLKKPVLHFVLKQQKTKLCLPTGSSNDRDSQAERNLLFQSPGVHQKQCLKSRFCQNL